MSELEVDLTEVGLIIAGLTFIDHDRLTREGKAARVRLAHKLSAAYSELVAANDGAP